VPPNAKSLVLIVDDPDAPMGTFTHWLLWNIDPKIKEIKENSVPADAIIGTNDFGKTAYGGPCPPSGVHRYYFKVYALNTVLDLPAGANRSQLEKAIEGYILDYGELMGKFSK
jgi:Raf kinase inhibitor-like YbhB/YbcL family protein